MPCSYKITKGPNSGKVCGKKCKEALCATHKKQKKPVENPISQQVEKKSCHQAKCPDGVLSGNEYTKEKRQELYGRVAGGAGSKKPEEFQRRQIELGTGVLCPPTHMRINWRTNEMVDITQPMREEDGFDYTEDFDGKQEFAEKDVYNNFKSVVGTGGSQTKTLRDQSYRFISEQLNYLVKHKTTTIYFANIFDGDVAAAVMDKFDYLMDLPEYSEVKQYVYVGDLRGYFEWVSM